MCIFVFVAYCYLACPLKWISLETCLLNEFRFDDVASPLRWRREACFSIGYENAFPGRLTSHSYYHNSCVVTSIAATYFPTVCLSCHASLTSRFLSLVYCLICFSYSLFVCLFIPLPLDPSSMTLIHDVPLLLYCRRCLRWLSPPLPFFIIKIIDWWILLGIFIFNLHDSCLSSV